MVLSMGGAGGARAGENGHVLLGEIAGVSRTVAGTSARLAKIETLAGALRAAGPLEVPVAVAYLSGELPQRQIGVGWAALRDRLDARADVPTLDAARRGRGASPRSARCPGPGSAGGAQGAGRRAVRPGHRGGAAVPGAAADRRAAPGRAGRGMAEAVARAAAVPAAEVRRALMLRGSLGAVAAAALPAAGRAGARSGWRWAARSRPMLAQSAPSITEALAKAGRPGGGGVEAGRHPGAGAP